MASSIHKNEGSECFCCRGEQYPSVHTVNHRGEQHRKERAEDGAGGEGQRQRADQRGACAQGPTLVLFSAQPGHFLLTPVLFFSSTLVRFAPTYNLRTFSWVISETKTAPFELKSRRVGDPASALQDG
jgi:hypothetical protein